MESYFDKQLHQVELNLYAQNNRISFPDGSKMHPGFKLLYPIICHKSSELFKYFLGLQCIAQGEKPIGHELLIWVLMFLKLQNGC
jgi:hypothetical protein